MATDTKPQDEQIEEVKADGTEPAAEETKDAYAEIDQQIADAESAKSKLQIEIGELDISTDPKKFGQLVNEYSKKDKAIKKLQGDRTALVVEPLRQNILDQIAVIVAASADRYEQVTGEALERVVFDVKTNEAGEPEYDVSLNTIPRRKTGTSTSGGGSSSEGPGANDEVTNGEVTLTVKEVVKQFSSESRLDSWLRTDRVEAKGGGWDNTDRNWKLWFRYVNKDEEDAGRPKFVAVEKEGEEAA